jgi:hypothetical protein
LASMEINGRISGAYRNLGILMRVLLAGGALGFTLSLPLLGAQPPEGPAGIFVIGDTHAVVGEVAKFDLDYVAGYTLRVAWGDLESWNTVTQSPVYDFSRIDSTLEDLRSRGKRMTLEIFINKVPDYVLGLPGVVTWNNPHPTQGGTQVVPWDATALSVYQAMIQSLANHQVAGTSWSVADHPALQSVDASIVGLQGLREISNTLVHHPEYTRERFIQGVVDAVAISRQAFAQKYGFLALFRMTDDIASPALDATVYARLMTEFNVAGKPSLGFFQETLSDTGPKTDAVGQLLATAAPSTYVLFQALRPWSLPDGETRPPEIASGTPITGVENAWANYSSTYVELYGADILAAENAAGLRAWNHFFQAVAAVRGARDTPVLEPLTGGGLRMRWAADALLQYRLWKSTDLVSWSLLATSEPIDGDVPLPVSGEARQFYRTEILAPVR